MTREQYLHMKTDLKCRAVALKLARAQYKGEQRAGRVESAIIMCASLRRDRSVYRVRHIFMSLLRGKTREQVEQKAKTCANEQALIELCEQYRVKYVTGQIPFAKKGVNRRVVFIEREGKKPVPGEASVQENSVQMNV